MAGDLKAQQDVQVQQAARTQSEGGAPDRKENTPDSKASSVSDMEILYEEKGNGICVELQCIKLTNRIIELYRFVFVEDKPYVRVKAPKMEPRTISTVKANVAVSKIPVGTPMQLKRRTCSWWA